MEPAIDHMTIFLAVLLGALFAFLIGGAIWMRISRFSEELRYINMELHRCSSRERPTWRRRRRKLWLWLFCLCRR